MNTSCPNCNSSKGERMISEVLDDLYIPFTKEYSVNIDGINYRFDFFISELNTIIEYDGIQHFQSVDFFGGEDNYQKVKLNDSMKNEWCEKNSINLIRIPYNVNLEMFLLESLRKILL